MLSPGARKLKEQLDRVGPPAAAVTPPQPETNPPTAAIRRRVAEVHDEATQDEPRGSFEAFWNFASSALTDDAFYS